MEWLRSSQRQTFGYDDLTSSLEIWTLVLRRTCVHILDGILDQGKKINQLGRCRQKAARGSLISGKGLVFLSRPNNQNTHFRHLNTLCINCAGESLIWSIHRVKRHLNAGEKVILPQDRSRMHSRTRNWKRDSRHLHTRRTQLECITQSSEACGLLFNRCHVLAPKSITVRKMIHLSIWADINGRGFIKDQEQELVHPSR